MASPATSTETRLWHPFAAMGKVDGHELVLTRGEGCRVWDVDGTSTSTRRQGSGSSTSGTAARRSPMPLPSSCGPSPRTTSSATTRTRLRSSSRRDSPTSRPSRTPRSSSARAVARRSTRPRRSRGGTGRSWAIPSGRWCSHAASRTTARTHTGRRSPASRRCATGTERSSVTSARSRTTTRTTSRASSTSWTAASAAFVGEPVIGAGGVIPPPDGYWPAVAGDLPRARRAPHRGRGHLRLRRLGAGSAASATASSPIS
jgi:hypothetical protein